MDEVVEVSVAATESNPSGWALGRVKTIKQSFYFISFAGSQKTKQDLIVERSALRRSNSESSLDVSTLVRRAIPIAPELHVWIRSEDSYGCLSHVQSKARLLVAARINVDSNTTKHPEVVLIGGQREVDLGEKLLLQVHFRHQIAEERHSQRCDELLARLVERRQWYSEQNQEAFTIDSSLVGKLIGKKGENINRIREEFAVEVYIEDDYETADGDRYYSQVTITGSTPESVKGAREELEFITVQIPVESDQVGWILGKGYQTIGDIARKTELHYARYDDKKGALELCGLRHQVEDAKLLISVHRGYLSVYQDMDEEKDAINQSFNQLAGGSKGSKSGKGKGKKGGKSSDDWSEDEDERKGGKSKGKTKKGGLRSDWSDDEEEEEEVKGKGKGGKSKAKGGSGKANSPQENGYAEPEDRSSKGKGSKSAGKAAFNGEGSGKGEKSRRKR